MIRVPLRCLVVLQSLLDDDPTCLGVATSLIRSLLATIHLKLYSFALLTAMPTISPSLSAAYAGQEVSTSNHGGVLAVATSSSLAAPASSSSAAILSQDSTELASLISSEVSDNNRQCSKGCEEVHETPATSNKRQRLVDDPHHCSSCLEATSTTPHHVEASPLFGLALAHGKREDYLSWQEYFFATALLSSLRSKDPYSPSGACLIDSDNRIVGIGYNGFPSGFPDDQLSWKSPCGNTVPWLESREPFVIHAEVNCLLNSALGRTSNLTMYCVDFPCHECAKFIVQSRRVSKVIYGHNRHHQLALVDDNSAHVSHILLQQAGIDVEEFGLHRPITLNFVASNDDAVTTTSSSSSSETTKKPPNSFLSWDEYFMAMAILTSRRSKDPNTQVGACIASPRHIILACGYNGFTTGCSDDAFPWQRSANDPKHTKYMYVCHAEVNALLNCPATSHTEQVGSTLYVTLFPCYQCAQALIQGGMIQRVVYMQDPYHEDDKFRASRRLFDMAGIVYEQFQPSRPSLTLK